MSRRAARRLRQGVQAASLLFFLYLTFATFQHVTPGPAASVFLRLDPLIALASMLAARDWIWALVPALVVVAATLMLGRVWCGWICPLGTVLEYARVPGARERGRRLPERLRAVKYVVLVAVIAAAVLGSLWLLVLDPITIAQRTATTVLAPAVDYVVRAVESLLTWAGAGTAVVEWIDTSIRGSMLPSVTPAFGQALAFALVFLGILALNLLADRFWCRYLCPLGALLGTLSKFALLRPVIGERCTGCGRCGASCRLGAIDAATPAASGAKPTPTAHDAPAAGPDAALLAATAHADDPGVEEPGAQRTRAETPCSVRAARATLEVVTSECTVCLDCLATCRQAEAMRFGLRSQAGPWREYDPGRRALLGGAVAGLGGAALLGAGWWRKPEPAAVIRPPGVDDEAAFLAACVRCGECLNVCPTGGLQPALNEAGLAGLWTPVLKPRTGYCAWQCTACGQVCPTGAIPRLRLGAKRRAVLGTAVIDRRRCLPWAEGKSCVVCQEVCPAPGNAIALGGGRLVDLPDGSMSYLVFPAVRPDRCVGCGICENRCPVEGEAAIRVRPAAEDREPKSGPPSAEPAQPPPERPVDDGDHTERRGSSS